MAPLDIEVLMGLSPYQLCCLAHSCSGSMLLPESLCFGLQIHMWQKPALKLQSAVPELLSQPIL